MKKAILTVALLALAAASVPSARAGNAEWALAGKVLTGIAAASLITHAVVAPRVYSYQPSYAYSPGYAYPQGYGYSQGYYPQRYAYAPSCSYNYCPPPVRYCSPPAVAYRPVCAPPMVYRAPAYPVYAAAPAVGFSFNFGGGHNYHNGHGHW